MAPWPNYASRRTCVQSQIGATNSVIRGCELLLMAFTAWTEPALAELQPSKKSSDRGHPEGRVLRPTSKSTWASGLMRRRKPSCKLDHEGRCRDDHNRIRPVRNCSRPAGVSGPHALQVTFSHDTLMRLVHAFYPIFKLAVSAPKTKGCAQCLEEGRADRSREPSPGSELAPWERVLSE